MTAHCKPVGQRYGQKKVLATSILLALERKRCCLLKGAFDKTRKPRANVCLGWEMMTLRAHIKNF